MFRAQDMASVKLYQMKKNEGREIVPGLIYVVRYLATGYSGRLRNDTEDVHLDVSWLTNNCMTRTWRQDTICAHPGKWFRVPVPARTKQTAVFKIQTKNQ